MKGESDAKPIVHQPILPRVGHSERKCGPERGRHCAMNRARKLRHAGNHHDQDDRRQDDAATLHPEQAAQRFHQQVAAEIAEPMPAKHPIGGKCRIIGNAELDMIAADMAEQVDQRWQLQAP